MVLCVQQSVDVIGMLLFDGRNDFDEHVAVHVAGTFANIADLAFCRVQIQDIVIICYKLLIIGVAETDVHVAVIKSTCKH